MAFALREVTPSQGWCRTWDARWKLAACLLFTLMCTTLSQPWSLAIALSAVVMLLITVGIPWRVAITRLVVVSLGIALPLVLLPLTVPDGTARALQIATRAITIAMLGLVVLHTTPFADLLAALQRLRVPGVLLQIVQLAYRYTFEFFVVFRQMRIALFTRGFRWRASGRLYQTMGQAMGSLVVRGGEQSERVSDAMLARGYSGKFHTLTLFHTHSMDLLKCLVAVILVVVLLALEWLT